MRKAERKNQQNDIDESENGDEADEIQLVVEEEVGEIIQFGNSAEQVATKYSSNDENNVRLRGIIRPMKSKSFVIPSVVDESNHFSEPPINIVELNWTMFEKNC